MGGSGRGYKKRSARRRYHGRKKKLGRRFLASLGGFDKVGKLGPLTLAPELGKAVLVPPYITAGC